MVTFVSDFISKRQTLTHSSLMSFETSHVNPNDMINNRIRCPNVMKDGEEKKFFFSSSPLTQMRIVSSCSYLKNRLGIVLSRRREKTNVKCKTDVKSSNWSSLSLSRSSTYARIKNVLSEISVEEKYILFFFFFFFYINGCSVKRAWEDS